MLGKSATEQWEGKHMNLGDVGDLVEKDILSRLCHNIAQKVSIMCTTHRFH